MSPFCTNCGRELEESWNVCPDCGKNLNEPNVQKSYPTVQQKKLHTTTIRPQPSQDQPYQYKPSQIIKGNKYGPPSLVFGILGIIFTFLFGLFPIVFGFPIIRVLAIILGALGIREDENNSMAIAGLILGIIGFAFYMVNSFSSFLPGYY